MMAGLFSMTRMLLIFLVACSLTGLTVHGAPTNLVLNPGSLNQESDESFKQPVGISSQRDIDPLVSAIRVITGLVVVLGLFYGGIWFYRNRVSPQIGGALSGQLRILETRYLGQKQGLHVVVYQGQRILIGTSPSGIQKVSDLPDLTDEERALLKPSRPNRGDGQLSTTSGTFQDILKSKSASGNQEATYDA